jgi:hypothetical protein
MEANVGRRRDDLAQPTRPFMKRDQQEDTTGLRQRPAPVAAIDGKNWW